MNWISALLRAAIAPRIGSPWQWLGHAPLKGQMKSSRIRDAFAQHNFFIGDFGGTHMPTSRHHFVDGKIATAIGRAIGVSRRSYHNRRCAQRRIIVTLGPAWAEEFFGARSTFTKKLSGASGWCGVLHKPGERLPVIGVDVLENQYPAPHSPFPA